jgi:diacylglycerol kinase (ATP)
VFTIFLVLIAELINTTIERIVDRISTDHHALSGQAKDMGSAIVLLALIFSVFVWGVILV